MRKFKKTEDLMLPLVTFWNMLQYYGCKIISYTLSQIKGIHESVPTRLGLNALLPSSWVKIKNGRYEKKMKEKKVIRKFCEKFFQKRSDLLQKVAD